MTECGDKQRIHSLPGFCDEGINAFLIDLRKIECPVTKVWKDFIGTGC